MHKTNEANKSPGARNNDGTRPNDKAPPERGTQDAGATAPEDVEQITSRDGDKSGDTKRPNPSDQSRDPGTSPLQAGKGNNAMGQQGRRS